MIGTKEHVLVVDDEPQIVLALEDLLSDDFVVLKSNSPAQALEMLESRNDVAVVVSDQRMPHMNGDELLSRARACCNATGILLTGFADISAVVRAVNGAQLFGYVTKPWNSDDLKLKIQRAVEHFRLSCELAYERQLLHDLMDNVPDGIYFKDSDLRYQRVNRAYADILGKTPSAFVGKTLRDMIARTEDAEAIEIEERRILSGSVSSLDTMRPHGHGSGFQRWFSVSKTPLRGSDGSSLGLIGIARDVTERRRQDEKIARLTRIYAVTSGINAAMVRVDDAHVLLEQSCRIAVDAGSFNAAGVAIVDERAGTAHLWTGWPAESPAILAVRAELNTHGVASGGALAHVLRTKRSVVLNKIAESPSSGLKRELLRQGLRSAALFPLIVGDSITHVFAMVSDREHAFDAEEVKLLNELADNLSYALTQIDKSRRLEFLAYHDDLTGLPNRALLLDRTNQHIASARHDEGKVAVMIADIARLRQINETLGRQGGDALLAQVARRLENALPEAATLARVEGSAFAVLMPDVADEATLALFVRNILNAGRDPFMVDETELRITFRVGIALSPADADEADALLARAENALKNAKARAQAYLFYAPTMNERIAEKLSLETKLRRAIELEEFVLHYQPKVDLKEGNVVGLEALIRWQDPERGLVPPGRFIPILEETGMIIEVGRWALRRAMLQHAEWRAAGLEPPRIAVNVSAVQLAAPDFLASLSAVLDESTLPSGGIDLEITESVFVENLVDSVEKLRAARARGVRVAIDDFGTGYSSLGYLTRLPIDSLKIDRSFVVGMADDPQEMAIVSAIISLARSMDLKVVAEGVETLAQARLLRLIKCNELQGYLFARPKPADEIPALLKSKLDLVSSAPGAAAPR